MVIVNFSVKFNVLDSLPIIVFISSVFNSVFILYNNTFFEELIDYPLRI